MPRWVLIAAFGSTVVIAIVLGVLWFVIGGWPRDHDRYGEVEIPGKKTLQLPEGEVRLSFEGQAVGGGSNRSLEDPPEGLKVRVTPSEGRRLKIESVSRSLYTVLSGDSGHEPYGKVEVPRRGSYRIVTSAAGGAGSGRIAAGPPLWNPLGSRAVGAVAIFLASLLALLLLEAPLLLMARRRTV